MLCRVCRGIRLDFPYSIKGESIWITSQIPLAAKIETGEVSTLETGD